MKILTLTLPALLLATPMAQAQTSHAADHSKMSETAAQMEGAVHTKANVNSVGEETANVSPDPIPEIGWPAMTMDLPLRADAQVMGDVAAGDTVILMLIKGDDGMYAISAMMPE